MKIMLTPPIKPRIVYLTHAKLTSLSKKPAIMIESDVFPSHLVTNYLILLLKPPCNALFLQWTQCLE